MLDSAFASMLILAAGLAGAAPTADAPTKRPTPGPSVELVPLPLEELVVSFPKGWRHKGGAFATRRPADSSAHEVLYLNRAWDLPGREIRPAKPPDLWATIHIVSLGELPKGGVEETLDYWVASKTCSYDLPICSRMRRSCRRMPGDVNQWCGKRIGSIRVGGDDWPLFLDDTRTGSQPDPGLKSIDTIVHLGRWTYSVNLVAPADVFETFVPLYEAVVKSLSVPSTGAAKGAQAADIDPGT